MRNNLLFVICLLAAAQYAQAQKSSGYLGRRTLIGVTTGLMSPALGNMFSREDYDDFSLLSDGFLKPTRLGFYIAYANKESSMLQASISYQKTELMRNVEYGEIRRGVPDKIKSLTSNVVFITAGRTFQSGGLVSPIGHYFTANVAVAFLNVESVMQSNNIPKDGGSFVDFGLNVTLGTRRAITDRLLVDFGIEYNLYLFGLLLSENTGDGYEEDLLSKAMVRSAFNNLVGFRTGIYYLL